MINKYYRPKLLVFLIAFVCFVFLYKIDYLKNKPSSLIIKKCGYCHDYNRATSKMMSETRWSATVRRMQSKQKGWISDDEAAAIIAELKDKYLLSGEFLFKKRCVNCHQQINKMDLLSLEKTSQGWIRSIERMRKKYSFFIGIDEAQEIGMFLTNPRNNINLKIENTKYDDLEGIFENKCGACHSYNFLYKKAYTLSRWGEILKRMQGKSSFILKDRDLENIQDYIAENKTLLVK